MTPAPKRRWFRFSLRELLLLLAIVVVFDYVRCANNPKLNASGVFAGDMIFVGIAVLTVAVMWAALRGRRRRPTQS